MSALRLKELREQEKLTQHEIAKILNATQQNYARWESGKNQPTLEMLCKIADYYKVSLDYICNHKTVGTTDLGYLTTQQRQLIELIKELNSTNLIKAVGYLNGLIAGQ